MANRWGSMETVTDFIFSEPFPVSKLWNKSHITPFYKMVEEPREHLIQPFSFFHSPTLTSIHDHWKTIALTRRTLVGKVMSLLLNMLSRLVITFLPRSNHLLILWLQSPSIVILEPSKIKSVTVSIVSPCICHEVMGPDAMILFYEC